MTRPSFSRTFHGQIKTSGYGIATTTLVVPAVVAEESVTGVKRRKPKGWTPPTGYHFLRRDVSLQAGTCHTSVNSSNWTKYEGVVGQSSRFNGYNHFNNTLSEATALAPLSTNAALIAARSKIKNKKVDLGVAFAERKQTANFIGDTTRRIADSIRAMQRGQYRNAMRNLGVRTPVKKPPGSNWVDHWMASQYAVKPLLSDVYGSVDALSKRERSDWRVTAKASRRDEDTYYTLRPPLGSTGPTGNYDAHSLAARRRRGVFVRIDAIPENDLTMSLSSLGITNPALVAWERVPYSFVVDWFIPIGGWLDSLDALLGYGQAWTSISTRNEATWEDVGLSKVWSKTKYVKNSFRGTKRLFELNRTAQSGVPLPSFPSFKDPVSLTHMANGLSLLAGALGRSNVRW